MRAPNEVNNETGKLQEVIMNKSTKNANLSLYLTFILTVCYIHIKGEI
jgi:hypothetical protein